MYGAARVEAAMSLWDEQYIARQGRYFPAEELVRFLGRTYGSVTDRKAGGLLAVDIGCGVGGNIIALADWGFSVIGLERSVEAIKLAREYVDGKGIGFAVNFHMYYAPEQTRLPCGSVDTIIDIQTIQHVGEVAHEVMYCEVNRMLKRGGKFFSIHWVGNPEDREAIFPAHPELSIWQSSTTIRTMIEEAGLEVTSLEIVSKTYKDKIGRWAIIEAVKK